MGDVGQGADCRQGDLAGVIADQLADRHGGVRRWRGRGLWVRRIAPQCRQIRIGNRAVEVGAPGFWRFAQRARRADGNRHLIAGLLQQMLCHGKANVTWRIARNNADQLQ
ncbi:hypothetical protein D3C71_1632570 [compost metagenome]